MDSDHHTVVIRKVGSHFSEFYSIKTYNKTESYVHIMFLSSVKYERLPIYKHV